jgi:hypothetical protein
MNKENLAITISLIALAITLASCGIIIYGQYNTDNNTDINQTINELATKLENVKQSDDSSWESILNTKNDVLLLKNNITNLKGDIDDIRYCADRYDEEDEFESFVSCLNKRL